MKRFPLDKSHKLCRLTDIENLFSAKDSHASLAYPIRALWRKNTRRDNKDARVKILVSIPKKRLRKAVDRVTMRRRIREAYRLNRPEFEPLHLDGYDVAFIYIADKTRPYSHIERSMRRLLSVIHPAESNSDEPVENNQTLD